MAVELVVALVLLLGNAFFVAVEFSVARLRPTQVHEWERSARPGAKSARHAVEHIDAYLAACQLGITICSLGLGAVGEPAFEHLLQPLLGDDAHVGGVAASAVVGFALITLLHVVVGELSPKSLAIARTGPTALVLTPPMRVFYLATRPLVDLFNAMGNLLLKPFGVPPAREAGHAPHSEDELRELLHESAKQGLIDVEESRIGERALLFGDLRAREVMTPRPEVDFVTTDQNLAVIAEHIRRSGRTRLPLCAPDAGLDGALGILHAKDLLIATTNGSDTSPQQLARPLPRVSEATLIDEVLHALRRAHQHAALVVDEHSTVVGLLTLEDIIEQIIGDIEDEFDARSAQLVRHENGTLIVDGAASLRLVADELGVAFEGSHEATIGGLIIERLGRIPNSGETLELDGWRAQVTRVEQAVIKELRFTATGAQPTTGS
ncbi:MAG: hemolysin family protein [Chloroflexota bacterium]|nr:hemolysin family protein [Chloroflexota bacterium]